MAALSGLKIYQNTLDYNTDSPKYKIALSECELEVVDEKDIGYSKNGKPLATFIKRTYKVKIKSTPFLMPTNYVNSTSANEESRLEALYNKNTKATLNAPEESKIGLYSYLRKRRFFYSVQGLFPPAYGDFEGNIKVINSTENQNYAILEGTIHLCID